MASWMLARASSSVSPSDQQPGRAGTDTLMPSSVRCSATLYFMKHLLPDRIVVAPPALQGPHSVASSRHALALPLAHSRLASRLHPGRSALRGEARERS